ncbi:probable sugar phosphate/phosphate translocator At1g06470 [Impatiens glandulifera]|uniref:probable sugar phosphate/phosphate translocator At1g06470 n=1 Tax=Impatiens glandulifera TaxID=253017 RepID=UPI001FB17A49|nr:probable sugar phosphate/phosphate translocator At1g06470 [Impatiens glandulifera]
MLQSNLNEEEIKTSDIKNSQTESESESEFESLVLPRDPSFSGWSDDIADFRSDHLLGKSADIVEDFRFELPLSELQTGPEKELLKMKNMQTNGVHGNETSAFDEAISSEKVIAFNIENGSRRVGSYSNSVNGYDSIDSHDGESQSRIVSKNPISASDVLKTLFFILVWYTFSTFLTLYNKTLLGDHLGKFPAPLLMNTVHFAMQAILSQGITWFWSKRFQPGIPMSWRDYFVRVVPTALSTALDVNLSNESLVFISVTFATMCKSAAPIFLLLFAFAFRLESPSMKLLGIIVVISAGVLLTVAKEAEFEFWGFLFVMLAAVMSGFRWCMTQILLQKEDYGLKNPLILMSYLSPVMAAVTAILSLLLDPWDEFRNSNYFDSSWHFTQSCFLMLFGGTLAFFMVLTEYILVSVTSAVTVTIAGVVKESVTILVAVFYFHDEFTWLKGIGLITIMIGVGLFNWYKYLKLQKGGKGGGEDSIASLQKNDASKYVILEDEMDDDLRD